MNYMGNRCWWDERFKSRTQNLMKHERCLEEDLSFFESKKAILDVASGDGRNALYLTRLGFEVYAIDFSAEALKRLNYFAQEENLAIRTSLVNLCEDEFSNLCMKFDAIIINHYRLPKKLYKKIMDLLNPKGILWVNGFMKIPEDNPNVTENDLLYDTDFECMELQKLVDKKEYRYHNNLFVRYIWVK